MEQHAEVSRPTGILERRGRVWYIEYAGISAQLDDLVGLHYLAVLLAHPCKQFPAIELLFASESKGSELRRRVVRSGRQPALSVTERARFRVSHAIRTARRRISTCHTSLGLHLSATIHTGNFCSYNPERGAHITWSTGRSPGDVGRQ
jgi:hypothetical protein